MAKTASERPFLIQIYFVLASLIGLLLIVMGAVNGVRLGLNSVLGVKPYPEFTAPYPPMERSLVTKDATATGEITPEQAELLAQWEEDYTRWQEQQRDFNSQEQQQKREIAQFLAMLVVGIPVFAFHAPYVFRRS